MHLVNVVVFDDDPDEVVFDVGSDAPFNLGYALGKVGFVDPGVHVAVNGIVVPRNEDVLKVMYTPEEISRIRSDQRPRKRRKA